jgi:hypothetical protein
MMINRRTGGVILLSAGLLAAAPWARAGDGAGQAPTPTLTTEDVRGVPESATNANDVAAAEAALKAEADAKATAAKAGVSPGYVRVTAPSGYVFERPAEWTAVENLEPKGAPSYFKIDAVFQDPKTGSVITAISVERAKLASPVDVSDEKSVAKLLSSMLNPADSKDGIKVLRKVAGEQGDGAKWVRVKAQGSGQTADGAVVPTTFWVQLAQTDDRLALVAVGYPTSQGDAAGVAAFHTVRTLEINNGSGSAAALDRPAAGGQPAAKPAKKKNSAGGMRKQ